MVTSEKIVELDNLLLTFCIYYSPVRLRYNYTLTGKGSFVETVNSNSAGMNKTILELIKNLQTLSATADTPLDGEVVKKLNYIGIQAKQLNLYTETNNWEDILGIISKQGFTGVFEQLLIETKTIPNLITLIPHKYLALTQTSESVDDLEETLLSINSKIKRISSYVEALRLMAQFLENQTSDKPEMTYQ